MINVGDKFVVEISDIFDSNGKKLFGIKGFNYSVFDENGMKKLVPIEEATKANMEAARCAGRAEVWELVNFVENRTYDLKKIFNVPEDAFIPKHWIYNQDVNEILDKYQEWKKSESEIKVGDVVLHKYSSRGVVIFKGEACFRVINEEGKIFIWEKDNCTKTGKHIDIESILQQIKEG